MGGLITGGGRGYFTRNHGLASDSVTSMTVALADGSVVIADANTNPDLFWALRGGGSGNFGIVLTFTSRLAVLTGRVEN